MLGLCYLLNAKKRVFQPKLTMRAQVPSSLLKVNTHAITHQTPSIPFCFSRSLELLSLLQLFLALLAGSSRAPCGVGHSGLYECGVCEKTCLRVSCSSGFIMLAVIVLSCSLMSRIVARSFTEWLC